MDGSDKERLASLLQENHRRLRALEVMQAWASRGVSASRVSGERQQKMLSDLSEWRSIEYVPVADIVALLHEFVGSASIVAVAEWSPREQPLLMVPAMALCRSEEDLHRLYPDGMVVWTEAAVLYIDIDHEVGEVRACRYERDGG